MITSDPYGISHAERPWAGPGKRRREMVYTYDTPEQIAMCQRCAKPDCTNCVNVGTAKNKTSEKVKRFLELHEKGLTDRELIKATGLARATVCYWRKRLGLPPNAPPTGRNPARGKGTG